MNRPDPVHHLRTLQRRLNRSVALSPKRLGPDEINLSQEVVRDEQRRDERTQPVRELRQDTNHLPALITLQLADAIVCLHHLSRFDKDRLSAGRLIVYNAPDLPLQGRSHGNHQSPIAQGRRDILLHHPFRLRVAQDAVQRARDAPHRGIQFATDASQFRRRAILQFAVRREDLVNLLHQLRIDLHIPGQSGQARIRGRFLSLLLIRTAQQEAHNVANRLQ